MNTLILKRRYSCIGKISEVVNLLQSEWRGLDGEGGGWGWGRRSGRGKQMLSFHCCVM